MPAIPLEKLKTGRSYAADILDDQGAVLIPAATQITDELIQWITARNVKTVYSNDPKLLSLNVDKFVKSHIPPILRT